MGKQCHYCYLCFMHWLAVIPLQHSEARVRSWHGRLGKHMMMLLRHFNIWLLTRLNIWILIPFIFKKLNGHSDPVWQDKSSQFCAKKDLFCRKSRSMDRIPPTQNALLQHTQCTIYQAGVWTTSTQQVQQTIPSPQDFSWAKCLSSQSWQPVWMTIPEVSRTCRELIKCSCKGDCTSCRSGKTARHFVTANVLAPQVMTK